MIFEKEIKLLPHQVPSFTETLLKKIQKFNLKKDALFDVKLALNEALINAIKHGNKSDKNKSVYLSIEKKDNCLEFCIKDQGQGFDYSKITPPTETGNLTKKSGRGVFLIKNIMDELDFFDKGCKLKMVKYLNKEGR